MSTPAISTCLDVPAPGAGLPPALLSALPAAIEAAPPAFLAATPASGPVGAGPAQLPLGLVGERLEGTVERVSCHKKESGFCVLRIKVKGERQPVVVVGHLASVISGEQVTAVGKWVEDREFGRQFRAKELAVVAPTSPEGTAKYIASGIIKGIGPATAKLLSAKFGANVLDIIEREPDRLLEIPGIGPKKRDEIVESWHSQRGAKQLIAFLQTHGINAAKTVRIFAAFGAEAADIINKNPYQLYLHGAILDFETVDALALRMGFARTAVERLEAGLLHILLRQAEAGHCAMFREQALAATGKTLEVEQGLVAAQIEAGLAGGSLVADEVQGKPVLYLAHLHHAETGVTNYLLRLLNGRTSWAGINAEKAIPWVETKTGLPLTVSQRRAVAMALANKVMIITGGPGVGKTTVVNSILKIVSERGAVVTLCAPTGRAAKRLAGAAGLPASTVHRLLGFEPFSGGFTHNRYNQLKTDLVVIDEASMMDALLMNSLLAAIPDNAGLLIIGDVDQLPSVGPGAVLLDILSSDRIPAARLTEIRRQAAGSKIIVNAHRINTGQLPEPRRKGEPTDFFCLDLDTPEAILARVLGAVSEGLPRAYGFDPKNDIQVLTPMNGGLLGAKNLNIELQKKLNPPRGTTVTRNGYTFGRGDKVIQTRVNNYAKEVFNGDIGTVVAVEANTNQVSIDFEGRIVIFEPAELDDLHLAYATTIHKSQGSEFPCVVIPLAMQHYNLLERNLVYTAVTRGRKLVVVAGQREALATAVRNCRAVRRLTKLAYRLAAL